MVRRARLLGLSLLLGCKAEQLGVDIPRGGEFSVSQEDLKRDTWLLARAGDAAPAEFERRLQQMHTLPAFGDSYRLDLQGGTPIVCGRKEGSTGQTHVFAALAGGTSVAEGAVPQAFVISLAKAFDVPKPPPWTLIFCSFPEPGGIEAYLDRPAVPLANTLALHTIGPIGVGPVSSETRAPVRGVTLEQIQTMGDPGQAGQLDYRSLAQDVVRVFERLSEG